MQEAEKLHLGTKIRNTYIFKIKKMKANLVVQVLSNSVSDALTFLEHGLKLPNFSGASNTATFCKTFNNIFDLLNSVRRERLLESTDPKKRAYFTI